MPQALGWLTASSRTATTASKSRDRLGHAEVTAHDENARRPRSWPRLIAITRSFWHGNGTLMGCAGWGACFGSFVPYPVAVDIGAL